MDDETIQADMAALMGDPLTTVAGRYRLHHVLGTGGLAVVHEATDTRLDREVAVKLLRDHTTNETDRARFVAEARILGRLSDPHLVRVLDAGVDRDRPYLVLELVRGGTLADAMTGPLDPDVVAGLGVDVASALAHVHEAGIVHRDVKPGNVLLDEHGSAKLADFGIARLVDDTSHHTRTGSVVGTVAYLAPEQVAGERVTTAVDVYSLGLVLLEALTGTRPFAGTSVETAFARLTKPPVLPPTVPPRWRPLLAAMTARDPAARPTAAEVASRLRGDETAPARRELAPRVALVGAALAFAVLLGAAGWTSASLPSGSASAAVVPQATSHPPSPATRAPATTSVVAPATPSVAPAAPATEAVQPAVTHHAAHHHRGSHHVRHHRHKHHGHHRHHRPAHHRHPRPGRHHHAKHHHTKHHHR